MRRVGVGVSRALVAGGLAFGLATAAAAVEPEIVTPAPETSPEPAPAASPAKDDYYTRRARSVLEAEKAAAVAAHPLAARYPGMDVVVCEAGCSSAGKGASVVFLRRKAVPAESAGGPISERREGQMVPTSDTKADAVTGNAVCVAGCYDRTASADELPEADADPWYPSTPPTPVPERDKLSPIR